MRLERTHSEAHGEILHLTAMRSTKYGSLERYFVALAGAARDRGWRMALQYTEPPRAAEFVEDLEAAGVTLVTGRRREGRIAEAWRAVLLIARRRPAVVHLHFNGSLTLLAVGLLAHRLGVSRTVATVHSIPNPRFPTLTRAGYSRIDRIHCVSHAVQAAMVELGVASSKLSTRYLGVPAGDPLPADVSLAVRRDLAIPASSKVLMAITFKNPIKGTDVLVDAFLDHLAPRFPELHLVVVGVSSVDAMEITPRADMAAGRLHWAGIRDDVRRFLSAADVYVQPSRNDALGLAILEAMREALPVVASRVGGIPEAVADGVTGLLVPSNDPGALAEAIARLLEDPELARRFGAAGRVTWEQRFSMARSVELALDEDVGVGPGSVSPS